MMVVSTSAIIIPHLKFRHSDKSKSTSTAECVVVPQFCGDQWYVDFERLREYDYPRRLCILLIALISNFMSWINFSFNSLIALSYATVAILPCSERISCTRSAISANTVNDFSGIPAKTCCDKVSSRAIYKFCRNSSMTVVLDQFLRCRKKTVLLIV